MCASVRTPLGPEMSLVQQQLPASLRNAALREALLEEYGGAPTDWIVPVEGPPPDGDGHAHDGAPLSLWRRLLRRSPPAPPAPCTTSPR